MPRKQRTSGISCRNGGLPGVLVGSFGGGHHPGLVLLGGRAWGRGMVPGRAPALWRKAQCLSGVRGMGKSANRTLIRASRTIARGGSCEERYQQKCASSGQGRESGPTVALSVGRYARMLHSIQASVDL